MRYGTVCSGIEAPSVAWEPLGWEAKWFSEIEPFPKAVLANHYPDVTDLGDMTKVDWNEQADIDVLIGGTPCQSFSIAGLRKGLDDPRGNLALEFLRIVNAKRPAWVIWENVPGVLSSNGGRDFGAFLGALVKLGYGFSYRVLDAQYFGVPQRRRRVFVVGHSGVWQGPAAVLFERKSLQRNFAPSSKTEPAVAALTACGVGTCGPDDNQAQAGHIIHPRQDPISGDVAMPCETKGPMGVAIPINTQIATRGRKLGRGNGFGIAGNGDPAYTLQAAHSHAVATETQVRRLTEIECERLQGFPDNYTQIAWRGKSPEDCPSGHRYKSLGNSMAVPVVRWIGERITEVENV